MEDKENGSRSCYLLHVLCPRTRFLLIIDNTSNVPNIMLQISNVTNINKREALNARSYCLTFATLGSRVRTKKMREKYSRVSYVKSSAVLHRRISGPKDFLYPNIFCTIVSMDERLSYPYFSV